MYSRKGFTLVELLVAMAVLASIAMLGWRGLDAILQARSRLTGDMDRSRGFQLALAQMQTDCEQVVGRSALPNRARIVITGDRVVLVRNALIEGQASQLQVVSYRLKDGVLLRRASMYTRDLASLDMAWAATTDESASSQDVVLQSGVAGMTFRLWMSDGSGWRAPGTDVEAASTTTVPTGLEVLLAVGGMKSAIKKVFFLGPV